MTLLASSQKSRSTDSKHWKCNVVKRHTVFFVVLCIIATVIPILAGLIAVLAFPLGIEIPIHWDGSGNVNGYGSPWEMLIPGVIMSVVIALIAVSYRFYEPLKARGLVRNKTKRSFAIEWIGSIAFIDLLVIGVYIYWVTKSLASMT